MFSTVLRRPFTLAAFVAGVLAFTVPPSVEAGCGCTKPPPSISSVRPNVTYGGQKVTLFGAGVTTGQLYNVTFTAMNGASNTVPSVQAVAKRDLADGVYKSQLVVTVPTSLPLGPVGITVRRAGQTGILLSIPDANFTVAPQPVAVPSQPGSYNYQNYKAAVGRDGKVYISLDVTGMTMPRTIKAQAKGWPLRFRKDNTVFYNTQGFLMQLVGAPIPGLATITPSSTADSDVLQYQRHEFATYFLQHVENQAHSTDPNDDNWHTDGTRHIDHDHLILTIVGTVNGSMPAAGATPAFTFALNTYSFFQHGLFGAARVNLSNFAKTDSYNSRTNLPGTDGDILSNGLIDLVNWAEVNGDTTGFSYSIGNNSRITGTRTTTTQATTFIPVDLPTGLSNLGDIVLSKGANRTVNPGSYQVNKIDVWNGSTLHINNATGPVTLYVMVDVAVKNGAQITVADPNPEKFAIYMVNNGTVRLLNGSAFYGVVYGPNSVIDLTNGGQFFGALVGKDVHLGNDARFHYDTALRGE
jgi:hypothetical protein